MKSTRIVKPSEITDDDTIISVTNRFDRSLPLHDEGWGKLYIHRDSMGISGIVRASSWGDAYSICEDEFFQKVTNDEALCFEYDYSTIYISGFELWKHNNNKTWADWMELSEEERRFAHRQHCDIPFDSSDGKFTEHPNWQEAYGFCPSGGIYHKDLNGDYLNPLMDEDAEELELTITASREEEDEPEMKLHHFHIRRHLIRGTRLYFAEWSGRYGAGGLCHKGILNNRNIMEHSVY